MFLTAHRVVKPSENGRAGINTFYYRHGNEAPIDWTNPDPTLVAETYPGVLVSDDVEVAPGGNLVRSYLDVVVHDSAPLATVVEALERFRATALGELPALLRGEVGIRFNAETGLPPEARPAEFDDLCARVVRLLQAPPATTWRVHEPLTIEMRRSREGTSFHLAPSAVDRLREVAGPGWIPPTIRVRDEVREDLAFFKGDILRELVRTLLPNVREEELLRLGGVRVIAPTGLLVAEWPVRNAMGTGYCLNCHRHNTLVSVWPSWRCTACNQVQASNGLWVTALG